MVSSKDSSRSSKKRRNRKKSDDENEEEVPQKSKRTTVTSEDHGDSEKTEIEKDSEKTETEKDSEKTETEKDADKLEERENTVVGNEPDNQEEDDEIGPAPPPEPSATKPTETTKSTETAKSKPRWDEFEAAYLRTIPKAEAYEKSFMHRDAITHVAATQTDFIITGSHDGDVKFWKKLHGEGIEFVKHFRSHLGPILEMAVNCNGMLMASISSDKSLKIFDVPNFDMINMMRLNYVPRTCAWIHQSADAIPTLAVSDSESSKIRVYDGKGTNEPIHVLEIHSVPVNIIQYNPVYDVAISIDSKGFIEYWNGAKGDYSFPDGKLKFDSKLDTDLYYYVKEKPSVLSMAVSPSGKTFAIFSSDRRIRLFRFLSGKIWDTVDESVDEFIRNKGTHGLPNVEFSRRVAMERDLDRSPEILRLSRPVFDESGYFLLIPSIIGIKVRNLQTKETVRVIGKPENMRILGVSLCQAIPTFSSKTEGTALTAQMEASDNPALKRLDPDPMLVAAAFKRNRFYLFTNKEPFSTEAADEDAPVTGMERDVFNEKPLREDIITAVDTEAPDRKLAESAVIHTTYGDIYIKLFARECPKTVENFSVHARKGYFNGHIFHRVIKSFMIQTGDPTGKGTGGESIWGGEFEDEFHPELRHDKPYTVSMANAGPNTNGSQFFITVVPTPWLDDKHTVFGRCTKGMDVVQNINKVKASSKTNRPREEISVISVTLK